MTKTEILDFFTENYGVAKPNKPRKGKKIRINRKINMVSYYYWTSIMVLKQERLGKI
jgi:hypothetical protein